MIDGIEPLYQRIADGIVAALPETWDRAWMDAIFYSDHVLYHGCYQSTEGGTCASFPTAEDAEMAFQEMRGLFAAAGKAPWCRVRFEVTSAGQFQLQWSYDDCDDQGFARFDEEAEREWRRQLWTGAPVPLLGAKPRRPGEE
jgi:hypothetical protein